MKNLFLSSCLIFSIFFARAQDANFVWAKNMGGNSTNQGTSIAVANGNVYSVGFFYGTTDFDPGAGVFNLTSAGNRDIFISKFDASGNFIWAERIGGTLIDNCNDIAIDPLGNILITGSFDGTVDFDPGPGTFTMTSVNEDIFVSKFNANGNLIWAKQMGGSSTDIGYGIAVDLSGNVYTTGTFFFTGDFDPGPGTFSLTANSYFEVFVSKLDAAGNFVWAKQMGGSIAYDRGFDIAVDTIKNVYTTGQFSYIGDFDPGPGSYSLSSAGSYDIFISKLDSLGNFSWAKALNGGGFMSAGLGIVTDPAGNVYTTGYFEWTVDFDPGPSTFSITSTGDKDVFVLKLTTAGNFVWAKNMGGGAPDNAFAIDLDSLGNVYTTGHFTGNAADFDPGPGTYTFAASGDDLFISKLDNNGNFSWAKRLGSTSGEFGYGIAVDNSHNVYTTGFFNGVLDFDPNVGVSNLNGTGGSNIFVHKMCQTQSQPVFASGAAVLCSGVPFTFSVLPVPTATAYIWSFPAGWTGSSSGNSISVSPGSSGIFSVTAVNACGAGGVQTLSVSVNVTPTITVNSGSICIGGNFTMNPSGAAIYAFEGGSGVVGPTITTNYTVSGISAAGCAAQGFATATVTVNPNPTPTISVNSGTLCSGNAFTISPSGANSYTIQGGSAVVSPGTTSTYSVVGTSSAGCVSSAAATSTVTVFQSPTVTVNSGTICAGDSFTMIAGGAATYTFSNGASIVSPVVSSSYSVTGTSTAGCISTNTAASNVSVNPLPFVNAVSNASLICIGESATLTASGANSLLWTTPATGSQVVVSPSVTSTYTVYGTDVNGCSSSDTITQSVSACIGIEEISAQKINCKLYPNPSSGIITLDVQKSTQIMVMNSAGELILEKKTDAGKLEINLSGYSSGLYLIRIVQNAMLETVKVIKL
jgi:hypothetical protein